MATARKLTAEAHKDGKWWMISIPEINGLTQAKTAEKVPEMAADLAAISLDLPTDQVEVTITYKLGEQVEGVRQEWLTAQEELAAARKTAETQFEALAMTLKDQGYTIRDIATVTGYSFQRIGQLTNRKAT